MNVIMEKSFDSLEAALTQLIESISSYTPSPLAASALVIADNGISESLELLAEHQANHQKIQSLRATSGALDHRLAQLLSALAQTRRQLQAVPASTLPASRDVPYDELLAYARKISKYTRPSGAQRPVPVPAAPAQQPNRPELGLTEQEAQALDSAGRAFFPWPSEELMGRGALATLNFAGEGALMSPESASVLQAPAERLLPDGVDAERAKEEAPQANGSEESAPGDVEGENRAREAVQAAQVAHAAVFSGLDLYDPDED